MTSPPLLLRRLGQVIRALRTEAGYSQERFGFAIRVHRTYMGHLERGTANPTIKILHRVAQGLGVSVPDLFALARTEAGAGTPVARGRVGEPPGRKRRREKGQGRQVGSEGQLITTANLPPAA
jgi:transcriptional regulator with XRE-family HTH domain